MLKRNRLMVLVLCLGMLLGLPAESIFAQSAQKHRVTGVVKDESGEPLIGVSILELGTTNGIITDVDGNFSFQVQPGAQLQLSYVGYQTQELTSKKGDLGIIRMEPEAIALEDVTITGQMARTQVTPVAVSQVTAIEIEERLSQEEYIARMMEADPAYRPIRKERYCLSG